MKNKILNIGPYCLIGENLQAENASIGPYCEIKNNVTLGSNVVLQGRNRIAKNCVIDDNVTIKYGTILTNYVHIKECTFVGPNVIIFGDMLPETEIEQRQLEVIVLLVAVQKLMPV